MDFSRSRHSDLLRPGVCKKSPDTAGLQDLQASPCKIQVMVGDFLVVSASSIQNHWRIIEDDFVRHGPSAGHFLTQSYMRMWVQEAKYRMLFFKRRVLPTFFPTVNVVFRRSSSGEENRQPT